MSKISELSDGGVIQGGDTLIAVRSGGNVKVTYGGTTTANIDGGTIDNTVIGGTTPAAGNFTTGSFTGNVSFGDNDKAVFGASSDLQIYHDGLNSHITDAGTGNLILQATDFVLKSGGTGVYIEAASGVTRLYHSNALKLATTTTGIDVTGTVTADGLSVNSGATNQGAYFVSTDTGQTIALSDSASSNLLITDSNGLNILTNGDANSAGTNATRAARFKPNKDVEFYEDTGTTAKFFWDASAESLGIGTSSPSSFSGDGDNLVVGTTSGNNGISIISATDGSGNLYFGDTATTGGGSRRGQLVYDHATDSMRFATAVTERMRIDSSGTLNLGTTLNVFGGADRYGYNFYANGQSNQSIDGTGAAVAQYINRENADGPFTEYYKDRVKVGSIGAVAGRLFIGNDDTFLTFKGSTDTIYPASSSGGGRDAAIDLGDSGTRFKDLYLSGRVAAGAGSLGTPTFHCSGDTNTGINLPESDRIQFITGGSERARLDASGNLLVGTTDSDPSNNSANSSADNGIASLASGEFVSAAYKATANTGSVGYFNRTGTDGAVLEFRKSGTTVGSIQSRAGVVTTMVFDPRSNGSGITGTTNGLLPTNQAGTPTNDYVDLGSDTNKFKSLHLSGIIYGVQQTLTRDSGAPLELNRTTNDGELVYFKQGGIVRGSISISGSTTSYNTTSDYRLKENVVAMSGATERLKQLNPSRFNFIGDTDTTVDGFLAHEVADVVPEAITGAKDAVDDEGNAVYQGIDQSKLVPLLVATIQELEARIAALESN
jgi:hypothetical protein